jgi:hypothetical protein
MLTAKQAPYTGPYYGPSHSRGPMKGLTAKALKRAQIRLGRFDGELSELDPHYNLLLEKAMRAWQRTLPDVQDSGQYGRGSWEAIRQAKVPPGRPHSGEYALDGSARELLQQEWREQQAPDVDDVRAAMTDFMLRAEAVERKWHYSQRRPFSGLGVSPDLDHVNDCSSYAILVYHWAWKQTGIAITDPSGHGYAGYGNTWDNLDGHPRVAGSYRVGDLAHYDGHVMICRKTGDASASIWSSFGSEGGPEARSLFYRDDFLFVCRPPLPA